VLRLLLLLLLQGTSIGSLASVDMLFKFIKPLVEEGEDDEDMDEEVRHTFAFPYHMCFTVW
jgi:hypothetical protein